LEVPVVEVGNKPSTFEEYLRTCSPPSYLILCDYQAPTVPIAVLKCPYETPLLELRDFVVKTAGLEIDLNADSVLLYRKSYTSNLPYCNWLNPELYRNIAIVYSAQLLADPAKYLFYRVLKGIPYQTVLSSHIIQATFADKLIEFAVPRSSKFEDVRKVLLEREFVPQTDVRACLVTELGLQPLEDATPITNDSRILLKVTADPRPVWAVAAVVAGTCLAVSGQPFVVQKGEQMSLAEAKPQIAAVLGLSEEQIGKAKFFSGGTYVPFNVGSALHDNLELAKFPAGEALFVVADPRKKVAVSRREEAVKIGVQNV
jgi:hypothetical protein